MPSPSWVPRTEVRELLSGAFESGDAAGGYDFLIGPVLVTLACAGDATANRAWMDEEIRRHLGTTAARPQTSGVAERLITWWAAEESRRYS